MDEFGFILEEAEEDEYLHAGYYCCHTTSCGFFSLMFIESVKRTPQSVASVGVTCCKSGIKCQHTKFVINLFCIRKDCFFFLRN